MPPAAAWERGSQWMVRVTPFIVNTITKTLLSV